MPLFHTLATVKLAALVGGEEAEEQGTPATQNPIEVVTTFSLLKSTISSNLSTQIENESSQKLLVSRGAISVQRRDW